MIQLLLPSDPAESLASSHFYLMVASLFLLFGKSFFATATSAIVVGILYEQAHISTRLEKWLLIGIFSTMISAGAWILLVLSQTYYYDNVDDANKAWWLGFLIQKVGGLILGYLVYDEITGKSYDASFRRQRQRQQSNNNKNATRSNNTTLQNPFPGSKYNKNGPLSSSLSTSLNGSQAATAEANSGNDSMTTTDPRNHGFSRCDSLVRTVTLHVRIKQGRNLVAKDTNLFGKKTTSDPYAKVYLGSIRTQLGQTKIKSKTLNPIWEQTFRRTILARSLSDYKHVICHLFDHDHMSKDDPMGIVIIPLPSMDDLKLVNWYPVEKGEGDLLCQNATGEVLVEVEVQS